MSTVVVPSQQKWILAYQLFFLNTNIGKLIRYAIVAENVIDPTHHPCLAALPSIFLKAMKGVSAMVDAYLGKEEKRKEETCFHAPLGMGLHKGWVILKIPPSEGEIKRNPWNPAACPPSLSLS